MKPIFFFLYNINPFNGLRDPKIEEAAKKELEEDEEADLEGGGDDEKVDQDEA
jgi:hypothetical protein